MKLTRHIWLSLPLALVLLGTAASAQTWNADQQELWKLEELQWKMSADKDLTSVIHCLEIIEWLEWRERRKRGRLAGSRQSVYRYLP